VTVAGLVLVLGLVAGLVLANRGGEDSRTAGCRTDLAEIAKYTSLFRERHGRLPAQLSELMTLEGYRFDAEPWDCWHGAYEYRVVDANAGTFRLRSEGPDKKPDTPDDIVWPPGAPWR
jgi:hypothetical protein